MTMNKHLRGIAAVKFSNITHLFEREDLRTSIQLISEIFKILGLIDSNCGVTTASKA